MIACVSSLQPVPEIADMTKTSPFQRSRRTPNRRALTFEGSTWTYAEMQERIREMKRVGVTHFAPQITYRDPEVIEDWFEVFNGV